ncbi:MAG: aminotransferase class V-fold PLP-dependent enzyme [Intrasporangium sp.]|uniref:aminotransferase class V-fold PLP-dependent enzyme n=1 Tax=Intrasporangium sp. TaxID=1925024 RepID=UPI0026499E80|nr:aminotransferase class V-fold PLP-dependent enzyme [Intrasporangium sp.]MDN5795975.1 aminotransferase class V-fold PLP-dependent enzyme [Intrasporangium sp.]
MPALGSTGDVMPFLALAGDPVVGATAATWQPRPMTWSAAAEFTTEACYLNTASIGLPPAVTSLAVSDDIRLWAAGRREPADYDPLVERARRRFADFVHVDPSLVALGHQASPLVGLVAAAVPDGGEVVVAEGEFTSVTFPFAAHADRGVQVREVPLGEVADEVGPSTAWVAVAAVQSADGRLADLDAVEAAARRHGARVLVDLTQSAGWLDLDASRFDATVTSGYKWLLGPRGTAFLTVAPDVVDLLRPLAAGWFAGEDVWSSIYGLPLRLAGNARRFDVSPGWPAWVGAEKSLEFLAGIGPRALQDHALEVSRAFAAAAGLPVSSSAILSLEAVPDADAQVSAVLQRYHVVAAHRAGRLRVSFHVHNTVDEVARVGAALAGLLIAG